MLVVRCRFIANGKSFVIFRQLRKLGAVFQLLPPRLHCKVGLAVGNDRFGWITVLNNQIAGITRQANIGQFAFSARADLDHIEDILDMVSIGSGAQREVADVRLSRYACYLIVQNGDPSKPVIANGQTYFAMQTRRQELEDSATFAQLSEDDKRLAIRNELATHNKHLAAAAKNAGVESSLDYAIFQDHGYKGLYGGLGAKDIHDHKGLKKSQKILDHMGSTELAANLFRATQTEEKLKRENVQGKREANKAHYEVGEKVRATIKELGGTMPEALPTPAQSVKQIESAKKKLDGNK
jgi:DNA-damage-inducible protein D